MRAAIAVGDLQVQRSASSANLARVVSNWLDDMHVDANPLCGYWAFGGGAPCGGRTIRLARGDDDLSAATG